MQRNYGLGYKNQVEPWDGWHVTSERQSYVLEGDNHANHWDGGYAPHDRNKYCVPNVEKMTSPHIDTSHYPNNHAKHGNGWKGDKKPDGRHSTNDYLDYVSHLERTPSISFDTPQVPNRHVMPSISIGNPRVPNQPATLRKVVYRDDDGYGSSEEEYVSEVVENGVKTRVTTRIIKKKIVRW